jgi:DNA-binding response OmpR family regulator
MNILVHDDPPAVGRLVRAALAGRVHRSSIAASPGEARRKLETGLFDALVIGAGGASREIADLLETEWPDLPLVLAGVERDVPIVGPIVAVLTRPIRLDALQAAVRALEARVPAKGSDLEAVLVAAGVKIPGRVVARGRGSLLFEPSSETALVESPRVTVSRAGTDVDAELVFADAAPRGGSRYVAVRVDDAEAFDRFVSIQPGGAAC